MKILFLSQIIPYPPNAGPRVKTWHVLRYLAGRGHDVTLVAFVRPDEEEFVPVLQQVCTAVHTVPIRRSRAADVWYWTRSHLTGRPWLIERDDLGDMRQLVNGLLGQHRYDAIHADQLTMTQFALGQKRPFTIFDAHNATWSISDRMFANANALLRPLLKLEAQRIKRYEGMLIQEFDHTMVVIEPDKYALLQCVSEGVAAKIAPRISTIPIAVDATELQPIQRQPDSVNIMTLGSLTYPPNADGIRWFLHDVFPLVQQKAPQVTLTIIGKSPPADFVQAAEQHPDKIKVTGYVPDLTPYMEAAALMVVPVRAGGGMRVRLLEAFARAMPAVTTTIGLEGIQADHGKEVLVADDAPTFANETVRLLQDKNLQAHLSKNGRILAENKYDWQVVLKQMDAVYAQAGQKAGSKQ